MFQSTFPRGERRNGWVLEQAYLDVSIHVPTRGTTRQNCILFRTVSLFQSTFPRGERLWYNITLNNGIVGFNPRSHEGNDGIDNIYRDPISSFNPRSHEGNDYTTAPYQKSDICFNPRSHEGNDFRNCQLTPGDPCFNPRSHEGNDSNYL